MPQEKSQLKIGIALNYVNMILGNLIPIIYTPIMLALLGQSEYGLYKLAASVASYLSLISMGLGSAITRYLIKSREEEGKEAEERMLGLFDVIFNIIAVAALIVGTILTFALPRWYSASLTADELERMQLLVFLMAINTALNFSQSPYLSVVNAHEKFVFLQGMNIIQTCGVPCLNLVALYLGFGSIGLTVVSMFVTVLIRIAYQIYVRRKMQLKLRLKGLPTDKLKEIIVFSFWIFVANVVGQLYNATDTVMIGLVPALATTGVAVYNVGITLSSVIGGMSTGISSMIAPKANRLVFRGADSEELTDLAIKVGRIQGYIASLLITGFIVFGQPFIQLYAGKSYADAYWVAIWIAVPAIIYLVQSVCLTIIVAENKHRFRAVVYLFIAILNVVGTWFLMKKWGIVGAAAMSGIATIVGQGFIMNWYYSTHTQINIKKFWRSVSRVFVVPSVMCGISLIILRNVTFDNWLILIIGILLYSIIFMITIWYTSMNQFEKKLILQTVKRQKD